MKKWMKCVLAGVMAAGFAVALTACKGAEKNTTAEKKAVNSGEDQLAQPEAGDTLATLHVKGFGDITVRFFSKAAPKAVENFITHASEGYYDGVTFHRVINEFMIQGGDPEGTGRGGESIWGKPFEDEIVDNLLPIRGALCMANAGKDTNGSQFFIVQAKEANLAYAPEGLTQAQKKVFEEQGGYPSLTGSYTVFGQVVEGMEVVDRIAATRTDSSDRPVGDVIIESIDIAEKK